MFGQRRVGHAGTSTPRATGVLLVGLGRFTRMLRFLTALGKSYEAEVVLGIATSTLDASGGVVGTWDMPGVTLADARAAAAGLTGDIEQVPPMVSALHVGGRHLHELARAGVEVERPARPVHVERFDVFRSPASRRYFGSRSTARPARMCEPSPPTSESPWVAARTFRALRRTSVGSYGLAEAIPLESLASAPCPLPGQSLRDLTQVVVGTEISRLVSHGLPLDKVAIGAAGDGPWAVLDRAGRLLAVYEGTDTDRVVAAVVLDSSG